MIRRLLLTAAAALLTSACGVTPQDAPEPVPGERLPPATAAPSADAQQVRVWVVLGERLVPVFVDRAGDGLRSRVEALLEVSKAGEPLTSAIPADSRLLGIVRPAGDVVELQMDGRLNQLERRLQPLAVAQLVLTATERPDVVAVRITSDGRRLDIPGPSGRLRTEPLRRTDVAAYVQGPLD